MSDEVKLFGLYCLLMAFVMGTLAYVYTHPKFKTVEVRYDCSLAEISPDVPVEVKTKCRVLMEKK